MVAKSSGSGAAGSSEKKHTTRPSKKPKKPVTIDLAPSAVKDKTAPAASKSAAQKGELDKAAPRDKTKSPSSVKTDAKPGNNTVPTSKTRPASSAKNTNRKTAASAVGKAAAKTSDGPQKPREPKPSNGKRDSSSGKLVAGLIGGIVALVGSYGLLVSGTIPSGQESDRKLSAEIAQLKQEISALANLTEPKDPVDLAPIQNRLNQIDEKLKSVVGEPVNASISEIKQQLIALEQSVQSTSDITARVQQSISSGSAGESAALTTLDERVKLVEEGVAKIARTASNIDGLKRQLAEVSDQLAELSSTNTSDETVSKIADLTKSLAENTRRLEDKQTAISKKMVELESSLNEVNTSLVAINARIEKMETIAATPQKDEQRVARAYGIANLKSAIDSGRNYAQALTLAEGLVDDPQTLAPLKEFARTGLPTVAALQSSFAGISDKIVLAATPKGNGGTMDKLISNMRSLVKVKTTGAVDGDSPAATVSRIEQGLINGDLAGAVEEWKSLPEDARMASLQWGNSAIARLKANTLIDNLLNQFMTGMTGTGN